MNERFQVAIDGPGGAGKSTVAKALSKACGLHYVDTGAMYRAIAVGLLRQSVTPAERERVIALLPTLNLRTVFQEDGSQHMFLGQEDITGQLRTPEISAGASAFSAIPEVRAFLLKSQQELAESCRVVMDGRDIGTVVLPYADLKIFLTAAPEVRAQRRTLELQQKGTPQIYEDVLREMTERDQRDSSRSTAPLKQAEDAIPVDTTEMTEQQVVELLTRLVRERMA